MLLAQHGLCVKSVEEPVSIRELLSRHKLLVKSIPESFTVCQAVRIRQQGLEAPGHTALEASQEEGSDERMLLLSNISPVLSRTQVWGRMLPSLSLGLPTSVLTDIAGLVFLILSGPQY